MIKMPRAQENLQTQCKNLPRLRGEKRKKGTTQDRKSRVTLRGGVRKKLRKRPNS